MPTVPPPSSPTPTDWQKLHVWQIQPIRDTLLIASLIGLVYLGFLLSLVTVPLLLALMLAYLFEPLVRVITRRCRVGRPFTAAAIIICGALIIIVPLTVGITVAAVQGTRVAQRLANNVDALQRSIRTPADEALRLDVLRRGESWLRIRNYVLEQEEKLRVRALAEQGETTSTTPPSLPALPAPSTPSTPPSGTEARSETTPPVPEATPDATPEPNPDNAEREEDKGLLHDEDLPDAEELYKALMWVISWSRDNASGLIKRALETGGGAATAAASIFGSIGRLTFTGFLTAFYFYFFCTGWGKVLRFWESLIPERRKGRVVDLVMQMDKVIAGFVRGRLTICFLLIVYYTLAYWVIGVPAWLVVGPIVGLLTLLPYAAGIGIPVAMLLLWLDPSAGLRGEWYWIIGAPLFVHGFQQVMDDYFLTPKIQGDATGMDTPSILFASIAGGVLAGFYGLLLAIPVAACVKILLKELFWPRFRAWARGEKDDPLPIQD